MKTLNDELKRQSSQGDQAVEPLRRENERVVKENNELHLQVIQAKEMAQSLETQWKNNVRQIQSERDDIQLLTQQKDNQINKLENLNAELKDRLEQVLTRGSTLGGQEVKKDHNRSQGLSTNRGL